MSISEDSLRHLHERINEHIEKCAEKHSAVVERLAEVEAHTSRNTALLYSALAGIGALIVDMVRDFLGG